MLIIFVILTCMMIAVILSDIARYIIPNWLVLALVLVYPVAVWVSPAHIHWGSACLVALGVFALGYVCFILHFMGGGDIKLLTAASLYAGVLEAIDFLVYMAILGGIGTLLLLALRSIAPYVALKLGKNGASIPRVLTHKEPVPYGVAIAIAFLIMLWSNRFPGLAV